MWGKAYIPLNKNAGQDKMKGSVMVFMDINKAVVAFLDCIENIRNHRANDDSETVLESNGVQLRHGGKYKNPVQVFISILDLWPITTGAVRRIIAETVSGIYAEAFANFVETRIADDASRNPYRTSNYIEPDSDNLV